MSMVTVKVIESFIDVHTKDNHPVGEVFDVTEERMKEILSVGKFVEEVQTEAHQMEVTPKKAPRKKKGGEVNE